MRMPKIIQRIMKILARRVGKIVKKKFLKKISDKEYIEKLNEAMESLRRAGF